MESSAEKQARIKTRFDDMKISLFDSMGDFGLWTQVVASSLLPIVQLTPLIIGIGKAVA
jgi:hypothetical protein